MSEIGKMCWIRFAIICIFHTNANKIDLFEFSSLYNRLQRTWQTIETKGESPPFSSGSTAVVYHNELYIFFGFFHYTQNSANLNDDLVSNIITIFNNQKIINQILK